MHILIVGPQGVGKGTQGVLLAHQLAVPHISTGDIFRENVRTMTDLGAHVKGHLLRGELVPDQLTGAIVAARLADADAHAGFVLDGYPRTLDQARELGRVLQGRGTQLDLVLLLTAPDDTLINRALDRGRADDTFATISERLATYRRVTEPMLQLFGNLIVTVDGLGSVEEVQDRILTAVSNPARRR